MPSRVYAGRDGPPHIVGLFPTSDYVDVAPGVPGRKATNRGRRVLVGSQGKN